MQAVLIFSTISIAALCFLGWARRRIATATALAQQFVAGWLKQEVSTVSDLAAARGLYRHIDAMLSLLSWHVVLLSIMDTFDGFPEKQRVQEVGLALLSVFKRHAKKDEGLASHRYRQLIGTFLSRAAKDWTAAYVLAVMFNDLSDEDKGKLVNILREKQSEPSYRRAIELVL